MLKRQRRAIMVGIVALVLPAFGDRSEDAFKKGVRAELQADYDAAFAYYKQAYSAMPGNAKYFGAYTRIRFSAAMQHVRAGQLKRNAGDLTESLAEFQRAAEIDATNFVAQQELRRTADMIRRQERQRSMPKVEAPAGPADDLGESVELQPLSNAPLSLHVTANADAIYKTICKLAGLNVVIDSDYRPQKLTIDLSDVTIREALDMVRLESKTFWRPVLPNTIFVATDSPAKRKEIEQNVVRTFYMQNISAPSELQEAANVLRQILDVSRVQLLQAQGALVLRGTPDQMVLAERLLAGIDKPKSEVVIDVAVLEVSRDRLRTLGNSVPTSTSVSILPSIAGGASTASGGFALNNFVFGVGGTSFTFLGSDSNTKLLQNPEIRTMNDVKATLRIGDRVPIATGSYQSGVSGGGSVNPLVSTQFQYLDVGVNIDITPHIHSGKEVTLKMSLEISSVTGQQNIGGITQPVIGQRRIEHEIRLVDGEVNLLGGILEDSETQSMSGYPWISKIPILKYLFGQDSREHRETEIVFAITPHIVRAQEISEDDLRTIDVGSGSSIELHHRRPAAPAAPGSDRPADPAKPQQPAPRTPAPATAPAQGSPPFKPGTSG